MQGNPLAAEPERLRQAAAEIARNHPDASPDDVLLWAEARALPAAVRVEAGWDRTSPAWVFPNRLRITDSPLDTASASTAAGIRNQTGLSVADSHIGAVIQSAHGDQITVVTSDPDEMCLVAGDKRITLAAI